MNDAHISCRPVAPHWGAWIEILQQLVFSVAPQVAPHWGAWIEIRRNHL